LIPTIPSFGSLSLVDLEENNLSEKKTEIFNSFIGHLIDVYNPHSAGWHWFSLIEGRNPYWVDVREKRSQYKLRRK